MKKEGSPMSNTTPCLHPKAGPKAVARLKRTILKLWRSELAKTDKPKIKGNVTKNFVRLWNTGLLLPKGFEEVRRISRSSLYEWGKKYDREGLEGLVPRSRYPKQVIDNFIPMLPSYKKIMISSNPELRFKSRIYLPEIRRQWKNRPICGPIMIVFRFFMPVPRGKSMPVRMKMLNHEVAHLGTPYLYKLVGFVKNCLRGTVYKEDSQIIIEHSEKHYSWGGGKTSDDWGKGATEIFIRRLKG
jgi:hypothetical protein